LIPITTTQQKRIELDKKGSTAWEIVSKAGFAQEHSDPKLFVNSLKSIEGYTNPDSLRAKIRQGDTGVDVVVSILRDVNEKVYLYAYNVTPVPRNKDEVWYHFENNNGRVWYRKIAVRHLSKRGIMYSHRILKGQDA
jgi:hypothetical protein